VELWKYLKKRIITTCKIVSHIIFDSIIFVIWLLIAYLNHEISIFVVSNGVNEVCADIYKWISSGSTLILSIFFVLQDIYQTYWEWKKKREEIKKQNYSSHRWILDYKFPIIQILRKVYLKIKRKGE
jgi:hypothetical protein